MSKQYPKYDKYDKFDKKKKPSLYERFGIFFRNAKRVLKVANKPGRKDYLLVFKVCIIGLVILGALSWVIQLIFTLVNDALGIG
ncbi:MAG: protein translocase SEC61 complex subunit gamma [Candidatus Hodarchaeota archaeon]